ncbi:hypothetical protein GCM10023186_28800 [Hymenobacter koreensis]|uniref:Uncharacterized protein n=1 Tax=Hymenobacter koreensis TaxID=1084523 RepID=A0ABP8J5I8_9BACT
MSGNSGGWPPEKGVFEKLGAAGTGSQPMRGIEYASKEGRQHNSLRDYPGYLYTERTAPSWLNDEAVLYKILVYSVFGFVYTNV